MKKLLTITFAIAALIIGATSIQAQPAYKFKKVKASKAYKNKRANNHYYGRKYYGRKVIHSYYTTQNVWKYGRKYKNTYKVTVFRNGYSKKTLVNRIRIRNYRNNHYGVRTYYRSYTIYQGWKKYRVTYKIKRFPNGRVKKKLVKKQRIRHFFW